MDRILIFVLLNHPEAVHLGTQEDFDHYAHEGYAPALRRTSSEDDLAACAASGSWGWWPRCEYGEWPLSTDSSTRAIAQAVSLPGWAQ